MADLNLKVAARFLKADASKFYTSDKKYTAYAKEVHAQRPLSKAEVNLGDGPPGGLGYRWGG